MNLPKLTVGIIAVYMVPAIFLGSHIEDLKSMIRPESKDIRVAYAGTLPNVMTMTTEQHLAYLQQEYAGCESGLTYLSIIEKQHQKMPMTNALEVATMVESICPTNQP